MKMIVPIYSNKAMYTKDREDMKTPGRIKAEQEAIKMKRKERAKVEKAKKKKAMSPKVARRFLKNNMWKIAGESPKKSLLKRAALCVKVLKKHDKEKRKDEKRK